MTMSNTVRSALIAAAFGAASAPLLAVMVLPVWAQKAMPGTISIDNFTFNPKQLTVKVGTTVTWTNHDDIPHGIASSSNAFTRSKPLTTDDTFSFTFTTPGTYQFFCYLHPTMVGTVVVEAATGSAAKP